MKLKMVHVPFGKSFRVGRGDRRVFQSIEHTMDCIRSGPFIPTKNESHH
jgi:hypothetical protein